MYSLLKWEESDHKNLILINYCHLGVSLFFLLRDLVV